MKLGDGLFLNTFRRVAEEAKATCPVSKALRVPIALDAALKTLGEGRG